VHRRQDAQAWRHERLLEKPDEARALKEKTRGWADLNDGYAFEGPSR
jgi:hypothetical protein